MRLAGKTILTSALIAATLLGAAVPATAAPPSVEPFSEQGEDEVVAECDGFVLTEDFVETGTTRTFFDRAGNPVRALINAKFVGVITNSASGNTYRDPGYFSIIQDLQAGTETTLGLYFNIVVPGVGPVVEDVGRIVIDANGDVVFQAGPHQILAGEDVDFCELLP